jgi:hypothetical protein
MFDSAGLVGHEAAAGRGDPRKATRDANSASMVARPGRDAELHRKSRLTPWLILSGLGAGRSDAAHTCNGGMARSARASNVIARYCPPPECAYGSTGKQCRRADFPQGRFPRNLWFFHATRRKMGAQGCPFTMRRIQWACRQHGCCWWQASSWRRWPPPGCLAWPTFSPTNPGFH